MSQHSPYPSGHRSISFTRNGQSPIAGGTPGSSGLDGQPPRPTNVDPLLIHSFGNSSSITAGFLGNLNIANPSGIRNVMGPPDDRSRFAGPEYNNRLYQFYYDEDAPWTQERSRVRAHQEALPPSFTGFRDTAAPSECETSVGPGTLPSDDSGYGSQPRQSVGQPSVYGDGDRCSDSIMTPFAEFHMPSGSIHGGSQVHDVNHLRHPWTQGAPGRPDGAATNHGQHFACGYCDRTFRSQSDHKKHVARHERPHRCTEAGCPKATVGFGTSNDLDRHMKSVHRKSGTRYRCHHWPCSQKAKDWPRADNFRSHLKKIHTICLDAEANLEEYIYRPVNPEILSNVGVAPEMIPPEMIPPAVQESAAPPTWSQLERDTTRLPMSNVGGASEEPRLDRRDVCLPPPAHPRFMSTPGLENHDASNPGSCQNPLSSLASQQVRRQDLEVDDKILPDVYPGQERSQGSRETGFQSVPSGNNTGYVRPDDLSNRSPDALEPDSPEVIVLDDDDDDDDDNEDGAPEDMDCRDDDYQVKSPSSPTTSFKPPEDRDELESGLDEDDAKRHGRRTETYSMKDTDSGSDLVKPDTPSPSEKALAVSMDGLDKINHAEVEFQKLMSKLPKSQLEKLLRPHGYVRPKGPQPRHKDSSNQFPVACLDPSCSKRFKRPCEMKKHLKRHVKPYGCTECPKRFGSKNDWKRHENSQHFQHEIWKCDEKVNGGLSDTCGKVCHRRETFKQHLVSHHGVEHARLEDRLDKCRMGRLGEARFWCGFCKDVIELAPKDKDREQEACNAKYDHIDDHYHGRKGLVKKEAGEWQYGDSDAAEVVDAKLSPGGGADNTKDAAVPRGPPELRKRGRHGTGPKRKRAKISPPSEDWIWYCCLCDNAWSLANSPSCLNCPAHERCGDCAVHLVEPTEAGPSGDAE